MNITHRHTHAQACTHMHVKGASRQSIKCFDLFLSHTHTHTYIYVHTCVRVQRKSRQRKEAEEANKTETITKRAAPSLSPSPPPRDCKEQAEQERTTTATTREAQPAVSVPFFTLFRLPNCFSGFVPLTRRRAVVERTSPGSIAYSHIVCLQAVGAGSAVHACVGVSSALTFQCTLTERERERGAVQSALLVSWE